MEAFLNKVVEKEARNNQPFAGSEILTSSWPNKDWTSNSSPSSSEHFLPIATIFTKTTLSWTTRDRLSHPIASFQWIQLILKTSRCTLNKELQVTERQLINQGKAEFSFIYL
jgi:hypothetical protein